MIAAVFHGRYRIKLAIVIIGGLLSSLLLTLVVVPVVYSIFDSIQRRLGKSKKVNYELEMVAEYLPLEHKQGH